jgi:hypothetical protein
LVANFSNEYGAAAKDGFLGLGRTMIGGMQSLLGLSVLTPAQVAVNAANASVAAAMKKARRDSSAHSMRPDSEGKTGVPRHNSASTNRFLRSEIDSYIKQQAEVDGIPMRLIHRQTGTPTNAPSTPTYLRGPRTLATSIDETSEHFEVVAALFHHFSEESPNTRDTVKYNLAANIKKAKHSSTKRKKYVRII